MRQRISIRIACAVLAALVPAAPAAGLSLPASWSAPADVEGAQGPLVAPRLAFGPDGTGVLSTERFDCPSVTVRCATPVVVPVRDGTVGAAQPLRGAVRGMYQALPYGRGRLVSVGLRRGGRLVAGFGTVERGLDRLRRIGRHTRGFWSWTANGRGAVAVVFVDRQGVKLAYRPAGRAFRRPVLLARVSRATYAPRAALNERGDVLIAWSDDDPSRARRATDLLHARVVTAAGRLGKIRRLGPVCGLWQGDVALTSGRRGLLAWQDECRNEASAVYIAPGGRFRPRQMLERLGPATSFIPREIEAGFTADGGALAAWRGGSDAEPAIRAAMLAGERFGEPQTLGGGADRPWFVRLAMGPGGEALVTWAEGDPEVGPWRIVAAARAAGTTSFGPPEQIAAAEEGAWPQVAIDPVSAVPVAFWVSQQGLRHSTRRPID